jgi:metallo-beta-lactamase class B
MLPMLALAASAVSAEEPEDAATGQEAFLKACKDWDDWSKPAPPFRIYGNTYYVGTCGIAAILISDNDGHILIDGASRDGGPLVEASIEKLGFRVEDVRILLHSHEHFDHVGGLAYLQRQSGTLMIASTGAAKALQTGETQAGDPQHGMHNPFEPVDVNVAVGTNNPVSIGNVTLMPLETPGHTPGALSWSWTSCEESDCKSIVYADSLSPLAADDYSFSDHPEYVASYRKGLAELAKLPCEVLLTPHPSASKMLDRMRDGSGLDMEGGCAWYANLISERLDGELAIEASEK